MTATELLTSFGGTDDQTPLVDRTMCLAEIHGLVDVVGQDEVRWGRHAKERSARLSEWDAEALRRAFEVVPKGFVLVTDLEDAWRDAMRRAQVDKAVADVLRPTAALALSDASFSACVVDDRTYLASMNPASPKYVADLWSESVQLAGGAS